MSLTLLPPPRRSCALALLLTAAVLIPAAASASPCPGDCNADAVTNVNELIRCVNVALGSAALSTCASCDENADGDVLINELINAVRRALQTCRPDFAEAAIGTIPADPLASLTILDLGYAGVPRSHPVAPPRSSAAVPAGVLSPCLACASETQVTAYSCAESDGVSTLTATLDHCSDDIASRTGQIRLTVADADFCASCELPRDVVATQELTAYSETRNGETRTIAGTLTESFVLGPDGCRVGVEDVVADRTGTYTGAVHVSGNGRDVTFTYDQFQSALRSTRDAQQHCSVTDTENGTVRVEDLAANRRFAQTAEDLVITATERDDGGSTVTIDTLPGGRLVVDCFGGSVTVATLAPLLVPSSDACPTAGLLQVTFADLPPPNSSAVQFTAAGGVAIDVSFDGTFAAGEQVPSCRDPSLSQCRVELPPQSPPPTRSATPTPSLTPAATASGSATATDTPTVALQTATATDTPTQLPPSTVTRTVSATPTVPGTVTPTSTFPPGPLLVINGATGAPGQNVQIRVALQQEGDGGAASADLDIVFDSNVLSFTGSVPDRCTINPRIASTHQLVGNLNGTNRLALHIIVGGFDIIPLGDGSLVACTFTINQQAAPQVTSLVADDPLLNGVNGESLPVTAVDGAVTIHVP